MHTTQLDVKDILPDKPKFSHKGQSGKLLVVGGNIRYSGSPAFVALAAIRMGTDLTLVAAPKRSADIIAGFQPDIITEPLNCDYICKSNSKQILKLMEWADALVIGGGLGRRQKTYSAIRTILKGIKKPAVVDAEAIRAIVGHDSLMNNNFVLTPHENEFKALVGKEPSHNIQKRAEQVKTLSKKIDATILLKGNVDVISDGRQVSINKTGNPYMTKGGTGDVLAGICGSLISRGLDTFKSACAAAWINGAAGDMALKHIGQGFFVSEMLDFIPKVFR